MQPRYRFLFLMDPADSLNPETETSLALMTELLNRGHCVYWMEESGLYLRDDRVHGRISRVTQTGPPRLTDPLESVIESFDAFLIRLDPPFDERYLHLTQILDYLPDNLLQFNSIEALRNYNEKLLPLRWPGLAPPTLVTASAEPILDFLHEHGTIVLKPLDDCSGRGIERMVTGESALQEIRRYLERLATRSTLIMVQPFLPEVRLGDKRVYLVEGEPVGWVNRIPRSGRFLANIHQGARCEATDLTSFEKMAIGRISSFLVREGIFLAGLDFIGNYLTEINITSPSAIRQINQVMHTRLESRVIDAMLGALSRR